MTQRGEECPIRAVGVVGGPRVRVEQRFPCYKRRMTEWLSLAKQWARTIKRDVVALWIAARDNRTPIVAKIVAGAVAAYALSPVDLIPDFVPVLGYVDDLLIVPLGILLAVRLIPAPLMAEYRQLASQKEGRSASRSGLIAIILIWLAFSALVLWLAWSHLKGH